MSATSLAAITLAAGSTAALPPGASRRAGRAALPAGALALASLIAAGGDHSPASVLPESFLAVTAGLWLIGVVLPAALVLGNLARRRIRGWPAGLAGAAAVGALLLGWTTMTGLGTSPGAIGVAVGLCLLAAIVGDVVRRAGVGERLRALDRRWFGVPEGPAFPGSGRDRVIWWCHLVAASLALLVPHLAVVLLGVAAATLLGAAVDRSRRAAGVSWPAAAVLAGLGAASFMLWRSAAGLSWFLGDLRDGPFSPAFELTAVPLLALASWPLLGLAPFHRVRLGAAAPLAGAALWLAVAGPLLPGGVVHWQPLLFPLAALSAWYGAATRNRSLALTSVGAVALFTLPGPAPQAGVALVIAAVLLDMTERLPVPIRRPVRLVVLSGSVLALVPALAGGLMAETFYTVLVAAGLAGAAAGNAD